MPRRPKYSPGAKASTTSAGTSVAIDGLIGVHGEYSDPKPIRTGEITGSLRNGNLTLDWADEQPSGIPLTVPLKYINELKPITERTLQTQEPWHKAAMIDADSGGRFAIAQEQAKSSKDDVTESMFAYWNATRVN